MLNIDIYQDKLLKYPLTDYEYNIIDDVWNFIKIFDKQFIFISDYRKYIINNIRKKYTPEEFFLFESIANKLFWNLRWLLFPLWHIPNITKKEYERFVKNNYDNYENIPYSLLLCKYEKFKDERDLDNKLSKNPIFKSTYYRSFINKLIIIDRKNNIIITKEFEGSSDIFSKNYFNLLTMIIFFNRILYEKIMKNPYSIKNKKIKLSKYYYQYDYGFPNLNYCTYTFGTHEDKMERIKKMYYSSKPRKARFWFKLLR